jgi:DNA mismatch repair ATPase MutS
LYSNEDYAASLQYSFYFEGFINNMLGIHENLRTHKMGIATYYEDVDVDVDKEDDKKCEGDENNTTALVIKKQYYPALMNGDYIVNDADVSENMIITGPNASGKTTFLKTTVLNIIFSQQFGCGFYSECTLKPYTNIHSYLNIPDTSGRDSLFQAESRRCKEIIDEIADTENKRRRHFCIFDELYSGTNPLEASKSAYSFLLYLSKHENVNFILTTHYVDICNKLTESSHTIKNWKMDVDENKGDLSYRYTISNGISEIQGAVKVLRDMKYPEEIIQTILDYDVSVVEATDESTDETEEPTEETTDTTS